MMASRPVISRKYSLWCLYFCGSTNPSREMSVVSLRRSLRVVSSLKDEDRVSAIRIPISLRRRATM